MFLEISQNWQGAGELLCQSLFFVKDAGLRPATILKKDCGTGVFL